MTFKKQKTKSGFSIDPNVCFYALSFYHQGQKGEPGDITDVSHTT